MSKWSAKPVEPHVDKRLTELRKKDRETGIPVLLDESLNFLLQQVALKNPKEILEIGTATGLSGAAMLSVCEASLTTIEIDENNYKTAIENFERFNMKNRVKQLFGDASDVLQSLSGGYDFIFLDGAKSKYLWYLSDLKRLLNKGGMLFCDNVLFRGYITAEKSPHRFNTIVRNMREFIDDFMDDENYITFLTETGDGILTAVKL